MADASTNDEDNDAGNDQEWTAERLLQASYKDLGSPSQVEARFYRHLLHSRRPSLVHLLQASSTITRDYSITIDAFDLLDDDPILGHLLLRYPATLLPLLENAVVSAQRELARCIADEDEDPGVSDGIDPTIPLSIKGSIMSDGGLAATRIHARLIHLPPTCCQTSLATLQAKDVGKILQVSGRVVRNGPIHMYESARTYQCGGPKGCQRTFVVHADLEQRHNALVVPERCVLLTNSNNQQRCSGTKLEQVDGGSVHTDYQEIKIQEAASNLIIGHIPRSLLIKLQHDLVDHCQPGDEVVVVGSLLAQWPAQAMIPELEAPVGLAMSAHSIRVVADKGSSAWKNASGPTSVGELDKYHKEFDEYWQSEASKQFPIGARDYICKAVCPKLYGLQVVKLALLITLIGGVSSDAYHDEPAVVQQAVASASAMESIENDEPVPFQMITNESDARPQHAAYYGDDPSHKQSQRRNTSSDQVKTRRRDQSHLLLVGDAGQGKSQFLRFAAALCPRSVLTTGVGTTSAGLTCAAVREGNGKEFALEAGALVLADKGVCCIDEFGCIREADRTSIHEAMEQQTLSVAKAGIVCKLNCRATIIAVMNPRNCLYDNHASLAVNTGLGTPLLSRFDLIFKMVDTADAERDCNVTTYLLNRAIQGSGFDVANDEAEKAAAPWSMEKLRAYISNVKERFQPRLGDDAASLLSRHYETCRASQSNTIPVTVRFLESLIRLSQAHARLMYRDIVTLQDAVAVLRVMECSAFAYGGFEGQVNNYNHVMYCDPTSIDFSNEADLNFLGFEYRILDRYDMLYYMSDDRRRQALTMLQSAPSTNSDWQQLENTGHGQRPGGPTPTQDSYPTSSQDPYGRIHFSQAAARAKKPRY